MADGGVPADVTVPVTVIWANDVWKKMNAHRKNCRMKGSPFHTGVRGTVNNIECDRHEPADHLRHFTI